MTEKYKVPDILEAVDTLLNNNEDKAGEWLKFITDKTCRPVTETHFVQRYKCNKIFILNNNS